MPISAVIRQRKPPNDLCVTHGLPPTLFVTSGRDLLLSGTVNLHRAYLLAGVDARLVVYDALTHAFWYDPKMPEAIEANHIMADFFVKELGK